MFSILIGVDAVGCVKDHAKLEPESSSVVNTWLALEQPNHLGDAEVHLWFVPLAVTPEKSLHFKSILSLDEQERAGRFRKTIDAQRYVAARGSLRSLLGAYLAIAPGQLRFAYNAFGKPHLAGAAIPHSVSFSVSHSDDRGLFGFVRGHSIGVDLESTRAEIDFEELAKRYFSPNEFQRLRSLPEGQRREAFYCGWTRKEAFLKGQGEGLFYGLERVEVSLASDEPAIILTASDHPDVCRHWTLQHLSPAPGYVGAAAVEASNIAFKYFSWEPV
jgi:4'-phosphopantetheinyl transferase